MSYFDNEDKLLSLLPLELPNDYKNEYHSFIPNEISAETKRPGRSTFQRAGITLHELIERDNKNNEKQLVKIKKNKK